MVCPHFHHCHFGVFLDAQQGKRHPDVVVEVALGRDGPIFGGQYGIDQLFGGGFSIAARKGYDLRMAISSMECRQFLETFQRIVDQYCPVGGFVFRLVHNDVGRSFFQGFPGKGIAIEIGAPQCKKDTVFLYFSGIRGNFPKLQK